MISINTPPPALAFSKHPISIKGETNNYMNLQQPSQVSMGFSFPVPDGKVLALRFLGTIYEFTFKAAPDANNDFDIPNNEPDFATLVARLKSIRCFYLNYTASVGGFGFIFLTAKKIDSRYDMQLVYPNTTVTLIYSSSPANWTPPKSGFKGLLEVMRQTDPTAIKEEDKPLLIFDADPFRASGANGAVDLLDWDIQAAFEGEFQLTLPLLNGNKLFLNNVIYYWYRVFEAYGSPSIARSQSNFPITTNFYNVILARHRFHESVNAEQLYAANSVNRKFLTNEPNKAIVSPTQPKWLSVYIGDTATYTAEVIFTYRNGSTGTKTVSLGFNDANKIANFGVGFTQLGLNAETNSQNIWKYSVQVKRAVAVASELRTYLVTRDNEINAVDVVFRNELGCWDSVRMVGNTVQSFENETVDGEKPIIIGRGTFDPKLLRLKSRSYRTMVVHSKNVRDAERAWLNELLLSEQAYVVEGGNLVPCLAEEVDAPVFGNVKVTFGSVSFKLKIAERL
jgi:hypothetical protein